MWVRTQDKMQLVKINEIHIKVDEDGFVGIWVDDKKESLKYFLGTYKSKERAIEVLDEMQKILEAKTLLDTKSVYEMPKEWLNDRSRTKSNICVFTSWI